MGTLRGLLWNWRRFDVLELSVQMYDLQRAGMGKRMSLYNEHEIKRVLNMAVSSTETMNNLDVEPDVIKARLKLIRELADGLGINIKIPSNRKIMIRRILGVTDEIF